MVAVTELVDRLNMIKLLDLAIGRIKQRDRGFSGGEVLVGMAAAQLAGEEFLVGLDRRRADVAGQVLAPVPGLSSTTAAGLARRLSDGQWRAVETGIGDIATAALEAMAPARAAALCEQVTIDLDTTDVEVYGSAEARHGGQPQPRHRRRPGPDGSPNVAFVGRDRRLRADAPVTEQLPDRVRGLPVGQVLRHRQHRDQRQPAR
jgi:hypothetical protein